MSTITMTPHALEQIGEISNTILDALAESSAQVIPDFFKNMPEDYFNSVDEATQLSHLKALIATQLSTFSQDILLQSEDRKLFTYIIEKSYPGQLSELLHSLPHGLPLHTAKVFTAKDNNLILDIFHFGDLSKFDPQNTLDRGKRDEVLSHARTLLADERLTELSDHIDQCSQQYLHTVRTERLLQHFEIAAQIRGSNDTIVQIEDIDGDKIEITIGIGLPNRRAMFERLARHLGQHEIDIRRAHLESFKGSNGDSVALLGFQVRFEDTALQSEKLQKLQQELSRIYYLDKEVLELAYAGHGLSLLESELLIAFSHLAHQFLVHQGRLMFSRARIKAALIKHLDISKGIISSFISRFSHPSGFAETSEGAMCELSDYPQSADVRKIIGAVAKIPQATLATNISIPSRYALALRIDPVYLTTGQREDVPYGAFYIFGRNFDGFHVRFQDIARGGVRIVKTPNPEVHALETERLYDEAYGLAFAQQLKNKDIPEGGSKAVILTRPEARIEFCGRSFGDALLDLISPVETAKESFIDYRENRELLYLGPDENFTNALITWIAERAEKRGYPLPSAFISSKPGAGINHKEYGVTSEGVIVFLEAALKEAGIDPYTQPFTVKLTGGPDGDVAGNCIRILFGQYPDTAQIVAIADGSGYAEDPAGLDRMELLHLVEHSLPIAEFAVDTLSDQGLVQQASDPQSIQLRNTLHNRVVSDAFIPAGGRPRTVNLDNWREYIHDGQPSSRVVVEGANLFFTPKARQKLCQHGTLIVRDSSANKCGVICSSFEIAASMLLSEDEFIAIKEQFVQEVIEKLRGLAAQEAKLLMVESRHNSELTLPELSKRISETIERAARAISHVVSELPTGSEEQIVRSYLPTILIERVGPGNLDALSKRYITNLISSFLASRIVYREGLAYFEAMSTGQIGRYARSYLQEEQKTSSLVDEILSSTLPNKERIAHLVKHGATRVAIEETIR